MMVAIACTLAACSSDDEGQDGRVYPVVANNIGENVSGVFANVFPEGAHNGKGFRTFFTQDEENMDSYYVVNSEEEMKALFEAGTTLPQIDFDKYTLVMGRFFGMPSDYVYSQYLNEESASISFTVCIKNHAFDTGGELMDATWATVHFFWGLYPKFKTDNFVFNLEHYRY